MKEKRNYAYSISNNDCDNANFIMSNIKYGAGRKWTF